MRAATERAALVLAALLAAAAAGAAPLHFDATKMIGVDEIRPGMKGIARTVFAGTLIEEFPVEVLSVVHGSSSDGDIIMVQAHGEKVEHTGIAAGMSGSPVYIDGRLAGAIALGWSFSKDAVAGVTPIAQMIRSTEISEGARSIEMSPELPAQGRRMTPLPLLFGSNGNAIGGHGGAWAAEAESLLAPMGLRASEMAQAGTAREAEAGGDLVPGAAVAVNLVSGDLELSAIGTVTYREGDQVLCFGHPMFGVGSVAMPLSTAYVHTVLSSELSSSKMASTGKVVGALTEDRAYAIRGVMGGKADLLPVVLELTDEDGARHVYHYDVMRHPAFTANLAGVALLDGIGTGVGGIPKITLPYEATVSFDGGRTLSWKDQPVAVGAGQPAFDLARDVATRVNLLLNNTWQTVRVDSIRVKAIVEPGNHAVTLESAWLPRTHARPGQTIPISIRVKPERSESRVETLELKLPAHMPAGRYRVVVGDVDARIEAERQRAPGVFRVSSLDQALELLKLRTTRAAAYAAIYSEDYGASARGQELPALPGSVLAALDDNRPGGGLQWVRARRWAEAALPLESSLTGTQELSLEIESEGP